MALDDLKEVIETFVTDVGVGCLGSGCCST